MNRANHQRLTEARRVAELAALNRARRLRRRELMLIELYIAEISSDRLARTLAPQPRLDYLVPLAHSPGRTRAGRRHSSANPWRFF
jgi:hypothetical protein